MGLFLLAAAALTAATWSYGYRQALDPLAARGRSDLALAADRLVTQLQSYREAAVLLAEHPAFDALRGGGPVAPAEAVLQEGADKTGSLGMVYADPRAASLPPPGRFRSIWSGARFFDRATGGALGARLAGPGGPRSFSYAAPDFGPGGEVEGVLVVSVDLARLEQSWRGSLPSVWFTDASGTVVATNRTELLGWKKGTGDAVVSPAGEVFAVETERTGGHILRKQDWSPYVPRRALYLTEALPVIDMEASALVDVTPAQRMATLQAAAVAAVCSSSARSSFSRPSGGAPWRRRTPCWRPASPPAPAPCRRRTPRCAARWPSGRRPRPRCTARRPSWCRPASSRRWGR